MSLASLSLILVPTIDLSHSHLHQTYALHRLEVILTVIKQLSGKSEESNSHLEAVEFGTINKYLLPSQTSENTSFQQKLSHSCCLFPEFMFTRTWCSNKYLE